MSRGDITERRAYAGMTPEAAAAAHQRHRQVLKVLTGLLLAMFMGSVSSLIVGNALPVIASEIGGTQRQYTWIMTAAILAQCATTPIAGKLADLYDKKRLLLGALIIFATGSLLAGFSVSPEMLIAVRVIQGVGMGSIMVLVQITISTIVPPRQRGRYNVYVGSVFAGATVSAPLIGGLIVATPGLGWRWCFWVMLPFTLIATFVLARRLQVPPSGREDAKVDWGGSVLVALAAALFLLVVSFAGDSFGWVSWQSGALLAGALVAAGAFILVERRVSEPVVPLHILGDRSTILAIIANVAMGTALFGINVLILQYYQIGRGFDPMIAGWLTLPLMGGLLVTSSITGNLVTRSGTWKPYVVGGMGLMTVGLALLGFFARQETPLWLVGIFLALVGAGLGATMQNMLVAVQNSNTLGDVGAATATVTFFRTLGGAAGIQVLGVLYALRVSELAGAELAERGISGVDVSSLDLSQLPARATQAVRIAYGDGVGLPFLVAAVAALMGLIAASFMRATRLRSSWKDPVPSRDSGNAAAKAPVDD